MLVPMTYLVCYHFWLRSKGLTTYAHIQMKRQTREAKYSQSIPMRVRQKIMDSTCGLIENQGGEESIKMSYTSEGRLLNSNKQKLTGIVDEIEIDEAEHDLLSI